MRILSKSLRARANSWISPGSGGAERAAKFELHQKISFPVIAVLSGSFERSLGPLSHKINILDR